MITGNINLSKVDKTKLFKGEKGLYLDIILFENNDGTNEYGDDGMIIQSLPKEDRDKGERGPILGNYKNFTKVSEPVTDDDLPDFLK